MARRPLPFVVEKTLLVVLLWAYFAGGYFFLNAWAETRSTHSIGIALDDAIPFSAAWILPYVFVYAFVVVPAPIVQSRRFFRRVSLAYLVTMSFGFAIFALFPVRYPRPDLTGRIDGFLWWVVALNYGMDHPNNCFPSLHIAVAYLAAFSCWRVSRPVGVLTLLIATAIALSTLYIKQHFVLDIVAGLFLALVAYRLFVARPLSCSSRCPT